MARLPKLELSEMTPEQNRVYQDMTSGPRGGAPGPLAVWLNCPEFADRAQHLGRYCRFESSLPARLSELAILVTARIWDAKFEWQSHEPFARKAGLPDEVIEALSRDAEPTFTNSDESVVYRFSRELNLTRRVSDELYSEAQELLGRETMIDLVGVLGYYSLVSMTINVFEVDPLPE